ncbi:MAG: L-threonylcarbamoyladenylate synthase [bacterium]
MSYESLTFSNLATIETPQIPILRVEPGESDPPRRAVDALNQGQVIVFPTDTLYALSCRIDVADAVRRVFAIKRRPAGEALPVLLADMEQLDEYAASPDAGVRRLAERFWPGPLTIVVRRSARIPAVVAGGGATIGLRVPDHALARALIRATGIPLVGTSANSHGHPAPRTAQQAIFDIGNQVDLLIDGGRTRVAAPSTVVDATQGLRIVRAGAVPAEAVRA